jgi:hypothetical protein
MNFRRNPQHRNKKDGHTNKYSLEIDERRMLRL